MSNRIQEFQNQYIATSGENADLSAVLTELKDSGVEVLALSAFPTGTGQWQINLITAGGGITEETASAQDWKLGDMRRGFHVDADGAIEAIGEQLSKLAAAGIAVRSMQTVSTGKGHYAAFLWVDEESFERAAALLQAVPFRKQAAPDPVEESSEASFPASDPPSFSPTTIG